LQVQVDLQRQSVGIYQALEVFWLVPYMMTFDGQQISMNTNRGPGILILIHVDIL
jgi:hypothetical protein